MEIELANLQVPGGYCSTCEGLASSLTNDMKKSPADQAKTLEEGAFLIGDGNTLEQFHSKNNNDNLRMEYKDGKAWIYELPHTAHDYVARQMAHRLMVSLLERGVGDHFLPASSPTCDGPNCDACVENTND